MHNGAMRQIGMVVVVVVVAVAAVVLETEDKRSLLQTQLLEFTPRFSFFGQCLLARLSTDNKVQVIICIAVIHSIKYIRFRGYQQF